MRTLALLGLALIAGACAQIIPYADLDPGAVCEAYTGSVCANIYSSSSLIYVNSSLSQTQRESKAASVVSAISYAAVNVPACIDAAHAYLCVIYFPPCETVTGVALPKEACGTATDSVNDACASVFSAARISPIDYAANLTYDLSATSDASGPGPAAYSPVCVEPTDLATGNASSCLPLEKLVNGVCTPACPLPVYPLHHVRRVEIAFDVLAWIGLVCSLYLILAISLDEHRNNSLPGMGFLFLCVSFFLVQFGFTMTSWFGYKHLQCTPRLCKAQAIIISFGSLAASSWLAITFSFLVVKLFFARIASMINSRWYYKHLTHLYGWGFPALFVSMAPSQWHPLFGSVVCYSQDIDQVQSRMAFPHPAVRYYQMVPLAFHIIIVSSAIATALLHNFVLIRNTKDTLQKPARRAFIHSVLAGVLFLLPSTVLVVLVLSQLNLLILDARRAVMLQQGKREWLVVLVLSVIVSTPLLTMLPLLLQHRNFQLVWRCARRMLGKVSHASSSRESEL